MYRLHRKVLTGVSLLLRSTQTSVMVFLDSSPSGHHRCRAHTHYQVRLLLLRTLWLVAKTMALHRTTQTPLRWRQRPSTTRQCRLQHRLMTTYQWTYLLRPRKFRSSAKSRVPSQRRDSLVRSESHPEAGRLSGRSASEQTTFPKRGARSRSSTALSSDVPTTVPLMSRVISSTHLPASGNQSAVRLSI